MTKSLGALRFITTLVLTTLAASQQPSASKQVPKPSQIMNAKTVFIANAGGEGYSATKEPQPTPDPEYAYDQFYPAMKSWGRFDLTDDPSRADLVFEIRLKRGMFLYNDGVPPTWDYQIRLKILDSKTHFTLWGFNEHVKWASRTADMNENIDHTVAALINDVKQLVSSSTSDKPVH